MSSNLVIKVRRDDLVACMTCPICNKLFKKATTIPECLHTFCRKCIRKKLSDEELECCPICNIDLGCVPLEKLRVDHNLEDVRDTIFPYKRRRVKALEIVAPVTLPLRRKERSLSALVVNTSIVSTQTTVTGERSKVTATSGPSFSVEKHANNDHSAQDPATARRLIFNSYLENTKNRYLEQQGMAMERVDRIAEIARLKRELELLNEKNRALSKEKAWPWTSNKVVAANVQKGKTMIGPIAYVSNVVNNEGVKAGVYCAKRGATTVERIPRYGHEAIITRFPTCLKKLFESSNQSLKENFEKEHPESSSATKD